jgi:signal transduction histidine kinase
MRLLYGMRARTTIIAALATAAAFAGISVALVSVLRASLIDEVDRSLQARATFIAAQVGDPRVGNKVITSARRRDAGTDTLELLLGPKGQLAVASDKTGDGAQILDRLPDEQVPFTADLSSFEETEGSDNMRVLAIVDEPDIPQLGWIVTATSLNDVDETIASVKRVVLIAGPALVILVAALVWLLVGRALKPVGAIQREADEISGSDPSRRLSLPKTRDEITELTATINSMLERLDQGQREQQRFVADASHELRTPLAGINAQLDVSLLHPEQTEWQPVARNLREQTDRLQRLIDDLLLMTRWDERGDGAPRRVELVDLDDLVLEEVTARGAARAGVIDARGVSSGVVEGDRDELRRLVANLLSNALRHAERRVELSLREDGGEVGLIVDDDGPGIARKDRNRVFERYARIDEGRSTREGGSGLGLAICREIANRHGGSIAIEDAEIGGARFIVTLPAAERS